MATRFAGVRKNKVGTGWVYSVQKPGNKRPSYYRKVFKNAKLAAITRELEIINNKYDQSLPQNERNFTDAELKVVNPEPVQETKPLKQKKGKNKADKKDKKPKKKKAKEKKKKDKSAKKKGKKGKKKSKGK